MTSLAKIAPSTPYAVRYSVRTPFPNPRARLQRGSTLLIALVILLITTGTAAWLVSLVTTAAKSGSQHGHTDRAFYAAESARLVGETVCFEAYGDALCSKKEGSSFYGWSGGCGSEACPPE